MFNLAQLADKERGAGELRRRLVHKRSSLSIKTLLGGGGGQMWLAYSADHFLVLIMALACQMVI
jgi:hypothetical protein